MCGGGEGVNVCGVCGVCVCVFVCVCVCGGGVREEFRVTSLLGGYIVRGDMG